LATPRQISLIKPVSQCGALKFHFRWFPSFDTWAISRSLDPNSTGLTNCRGVAQLAEHLVRDQGGSEVQILSPRPYLVDSVDSILAVSASF
jgi:hypothetical protein